MCIDIAKCGLASCYRLLDASVVLRKAAKEKKERKINTGKNPWIGFTGQEIVK